MGRQLVRVTPHFKHPSGPNGEPIPGAHLPILCGVAPEHLTAWQVYENVSEGTPVSPVFASEQALLVWLQAEWSLTPEQAVAFVRAGFAPSLVAREGIPSKRHGP